MPVAVVEEVAVDPDGVGAGHGRVILNLVVVAVPAWPRDRVKGSVGRRARLFRRAGSRSTAQSRSTADSATASQSK